MGHRWAIDRFRRLAIPLHMHKLQHTNDIKFDFSMCYNPIKRSPGGVQEED